MSFLFYLDWVPITTPDGWVLLPSVSTNSSNDTSSSVTSAFPSEKPLTSLTVQSISTASPFTSTTESVPLVEPLTTVSSVDLNVTTSVPLNGTTSFSELDSATNATVDKENKPVNMSDYRDGKLGEFKGI